MSHQHPLPPKCANACSNCRTRKVKCTGGIRCRNCIGHGKECVYPPPQRKKAKRAAEDLSTMLERQLEQMEALLQATVKDKEQSAQFQGTTSRPQSQGLLSPGLRRPSLSVPEYSTHEHRSSYRSQVGVSSSGQDTEMGFREVVTEPIPSVESSRLIPCTPPSTVSAGPSITVPCYSEDVTGQATSTVPIDKEECILSPDNINWEHHGPGSWMSICSNPGVKWVCERSGVSDFAESAKGLTTGWTRRLKLQRSMSRKKAPELDPDTAWVYSKAYFEECHYVVFGIPYRPAFEARLRSQFAQDPEFEDDASWFALRNTVYASGCRIMLSKQASVTFSEAQSQAWLYFENALSVHTELLYTPTGLTAVQALALMSLYTEGLGSPALEYMLCSTAARLAQSKGLHRQPAKLWNVPHSEVLHRNWLFWAIYCCEKGIINRSGRPSCIDDDDISCQIPTTTAPGSTINVEYFTHVIKHAQIASLISKRLGSVSAFRRTPAELIETVGLLDQQLQDWRYQLPDSLQIGSSNKPPTLPGSRNVINIHYLHFAYYGSKMAINTIFTYPWIAVLFSTDPTQAFRDQVFNSTEAVAQAARNIILSTRHIEMDVSCPAWQVFYYPMVGLINMFVSILSNPLSKVAQSDVALLDIAAGHFAHLEFITQSELAFPFAREVAATARATVKRARERQVIDGPICDKNWIEGIQTDTELWNDLEALSATIDFDMEGWNVLSSAATDVYEL